MVPSTTNTLGWGAVALLMLVTSRPVSTSTASPGGAPPDTAAVAVDSSRVTVRPPSDSLLARFQNDPAFDYQNAQGGAWWADLRRWIRAQWASLVGDTVQRIDWVLRIGFYAALALIIGYAAYMLVRLRSQARAPLRSSPSLVADPQTAEEMRGLNVQDRLDKALAEESYRPAVRLLYLQTLQRLDQAGAIAWRPSTTNRAYVEQLDGEARSTFADLTRLFERIWYGAAGIGAERFERVRTRFEAFWAQEALPDAPASTDPTEMQPLPPSS